MVIKKGVTEDVPEDMELENLMQQFNSDNRNKHSIPFQVTDAVKLNVIVKETSEETEKERWVLKESRAICLTSRTKELPCHVYLSNMKIEVSTFIAAAQQCYKCGKIGHISFVRRNVSHVEKKNMILF
jgi:hypothetical protein